jgi:hypothetical protein
MSRLRWKTQKMPSVMSRPMASPTEQARQDAPVDGVALALQPVDGL